jgi:rhodanese-related sulfurtransferase
VTQPGTEHLTDEQLAQLERANAIFADPELERSPAQVQAMLAAGTALLVDIRETYEYEEGRIPGARHIEIERLGWNSPTLPADVPLVFYCRLGVRAKLAAHAFRRVGYETYNLTGGFSAWHALGLPTEPDGATVAMH